MPPSCIDLHLGSLTCVSGTMACLSGMLDASASNKPDCCSETQVYTLTIDSWTWKEHTSEVEGEAPSPRGGHSAAALPVGLARTLRLLLLTPCRSCQACALHACNHLLHTLTCLCQCRHCLSSQALPLLKPLGPLLNSCHQPCLVVSHAAVSHQ